MNKIAEADIFSEIQDYSKTSTTLNASIFKF